MAATVYGLGEFGLTAQTGLFIESFDYDFSVQEKWIPDEDGDDVSGALFKPEAAWSMSGYSRTDAAPETTLGATITLANAVTMTDYIPGYSTGGQTVVLGAKPALAAEDFKKFDLSGKFKPFAAAAA